MAATTMEAARERALFEAFKKFDVNGDGRIQAQEFNTLMMSLNNFSTKEIETLFHEADTDQSGSVDWREFIKWVCSGAATGRMNKGAAESFYRMLGTEKSEEAAFVQQASLSSQVLESLKNSDRDRADAEERNMLKRRQVKTARMKDEVPKAAASSSIDIGIPENYTGFRLPLPVTHEGALALVNHYLKNGENAPLHPKYVNYLTTEFTAAYKVRHPKPVVWTETPKPSGRFVIVGDTHGQLADVLHIFHMVGPPSSQNRYLFNGDIADRGHQAIEIFMMLFAFFLADPDCIIIHRGNHENEDMNALDADSGGGFSDECLSKYGLTAYRRLVSAFKVLSLCAVVEKEIFVVHGGLTRVRSLSLDYINTIAFQDVTAPDPSSINVKDQVFSDLLWADPCDQPGKFKSERGVGIKFGPDLTVKFCMLNKLRFIVRSHQLPDDGRGFRKQHDGRCVTIFSASNYCGNAGNYGAVLVLTAEHFPKYEIFEHYAAPLEDLPRLLGMAESEEADLASKGQEHREQQQEAVRSSRWEQELVKMMTAVIEQKPVLWAHIMDADLGNVVSVDAWCELMAEIVNGEKAWREAADAWGIVDRGFVDLGRFLRRWVVVFDSERFSSFLVKAVRCVYEAIVSKDMDLEKTFKLFDQNGDGTVDVKEVRQLISMFDLGLTGSQLDRITGQIFDQVLSARRRAGSDQSVERSTSDGVVARIRVQDFLKSFTIVYKHTGGTEKGNIEPWIDNALSQIAQLVLRTPAQRIVSELEQAAIKIQKYIRGSLERNVAKAGPKAKTKNQVSATRFTRDEGLPKMVQLFKALDVSGDGVLQIGEFVQGLEQLPGIDSLEVYGKQLDHDMLTDLARAIDTSGNGTINYLEFLQAFEVSETGGGSIVDALAEDITTVLFRHRLAIKRGCHYFDDDGTGKITPQQFLSVLNSVTSALSRVEKALTSQQVSLFADAMTAYDEATGAETVDYLVFLRSFQILDTQNGRAVVKRF